MKEAWRETDPKRWDHTSGGRATMSLGDEPDDEEATWSAWSAKGAFRHHLSLEEAKRFVERRS